MSSEKIATRLYIEQDLRAGATIGLDHSQAHFLRSVLRLEAGVSLGVFNGRDGEWRAEIEAIGKGWVSLLVHEQRRPQERSQDLWLVFAPVKRARIDFIAEKATELGVSRLQPVLTRYTDVSRVNCDRLAATTKEAAEQCERLDLPDVREPITLPRLLETWPSERRLLLCAEAGDATPITEALQKIAGVPGPLAAMTGPEGGFAPTELDALMQLPFVTPVSLGPRILRADTAALAALTCCQSMLGDWKRRPAFRT
ncbi:16S rRNA (uracil(1498)-N(3))-methyltransferase [Limibacillus sp. MBR-115]|jgi:16S rRNA (uracil1498-N3)-methyltransferase|uniref:16S rRNA (uracil(1498)-N(3))-methyltransferase n=1 Tax=Limibacillus sp. MBR-115 TaxID=3156465 RepID=UPI003391E4AF